MCRVVLFAFAWTMTVATTVVADDLALFAGNVSELKPEPEAVAKGWQGPRGLAVDDFNDLSKLNPEERKIAESLKKLMLGKKVRSVADFTYAPQGGSLKFVTLRVFVFEDIPAAQAFWRERWKAPGTEALYEPVADYGDEAASVKGQPKRAVRRANVMIASHQAHEGDEYLKALDACLKKVDQALKAR